MTQMTQHIFPRCWAHFFFGWRHFSSKTTFRWWDSTLDPLLMSMSMSTRCRWHSTFFDDSAHYRWRYSWRLTLWICRILNVTYRQNFWRSNMAENKARRMVPLLTRLAHGYPQGRIYKICLIFGELVYFSFRVIASILNYISVSTEKIQNLCQFKIELKFINALSVFA